MPVQATCPYCAARCSIGEQHVGQMIRCFACAQVFRLQPATSGTEATAAPASDEAVPMPTFDDVPPRPARLTLDIHGATTSGKVRDRNEDAFLIRRQAWARQDHAGELALLAVADGMGGYGGGADASAVAVRAIHAALTPWFDAVLGGRPQVEQTAADQLRAAFNQASQAVHTAAQADAQAKGMGAAAVVAIVWQNAVFLGHVGDCRAYHFRAGQ